MQDSRKMQKPTYEVFNTETGEKLRFDARVPRWKALKIMFWFDQGKPWEAYGDPLGFRNPCISIGAWMRAGKWSVKKKG
jgi:hypothetical protein